MSENRERDGEIMRKRGREAGGEKERGCRGTHLRRCSGRRCRPADEASFEGDGELREELGQRQVLEEGSSGRSSGLGCGIGWIEGRKVVGPIGKSRERGWIWRDPEVGDAGGGGMGLMGQGT